MVDARLRGMAAATVIFFSAWQCLQPIESKPAFAEGADRGARETSHSTRPRTEDLPPFGPELTVAEIAAKVRGSTFVISVLGREGERASLGSGFAVGNALIATNLHVIGDARTIVITDAAGRKYDVLEVYATDRARDLAVLKVKSTDLQPLPLGDSEALKQGEEVVGVGNPRGLEHSVVSGVVSGKRTIEGKPMIQLAVPIEQGNSGGPLVDRHGRVQGILTMKSIVTENLGFAVGINALKPLLSRPNPVRMEQWLTIGALEPSEWTPMFGARWRQRAGRVVVEGPGAGFGGRSLLLSKRPHPLQPFEIAVSVRLKREEGAAGIVFHFQDGDRHYGFYPSNGSIRLSRFDGPDVYSWHVLREVRTSAYHPGEWNRLRIRVEDSKISGYVNGVLVVQSHDDVITSGQLGLCSFRETQAEFRNFDVGKDLSSSQPSMESVRRVNRILEGL